MDAVAEIPQGPEQSTPKDLGLKFSGKSVPSTEHPQRNEDRIAHSAPFGFAMVLDGVGGLQNGDKASSTARDQIARRLREIPQNADPETAKRKMADALMEASTVVATKVLEGQTTATVVKFIEGGGVKRAIVGHVGDSRAYISREGRLIQITEDDNILSATGLTLPEKKALGQKLDAVETQQGYAGLTPQERTYFDRRNEISGALGEKQPLKPHIYHVALQGDDKVILTSDGVHDNLSQKEIEMIIASQRAGEEVDKVNPPDLASMLTEQALRRSKQKGSHIRAKPDDISAVVIDVGKSVGGSEQVIQQPSVSVGEAVKPSQQFVERAQTPQNWEAIRNRVQRDKLKTWGDNHEAWTPDPNEPAPPPPGYGQPGVENMGFVDLHALEPGTLVHFFGSHNSANYVIRIIDSNTIKVWRSFSLDQVGGIVGPTDSIKFFDQGPSYNRATDEGEVYKGALVRSGFRGILPVVSMPYFNYDKQGKIEKPHPTDAWMDTIKAIYIKRPTHTLPNLLLAKS